MTPYETINHKMPNLKHLRVIGCKSFVYLPKEKRINKLERRARSGFLVGYVRGGAYIVYMPKEKEIIISKDVPFDETTVMTNNEQEPPSPMYIDIPDGYESPDRHESTTGLDENSTSDVHDENAREVTQGDSSSVDVDVVADDSSQDSLTLSELDAVTYNPTLRRSTRNTSG